MTESDYRRDIAPLVRANKGRKREVHAHLRVVATATDLCLTTYEELMSNNLIYAEWKRRHPGFSQKHLRSAFVRKYLHSHIGPARATLAAMLARPEYAELHSAIYEALCLDNTLVRGRGGVLAHG